MITQDDRTPEEVKTHHVLIAATDRFMSGWGGARGGASMCAWACRPEDAPSVWRWVSRREEMLRVREVGYDWNPRAAHSHVYVVHEGHPALG